MDALCGYDYPCCGNCRGFHFPKILGREASSTDTGLCRAGTPFCTPGGDAKWPKVNATDWCLKHSARFPNFK